MHSPTTKNFMKYIGYSVGISRVVLGLVLLLVCSSAHGQKTIDNVLTEQHQNIRGSRVSIIPPPGFVKANTFLGFQHQASGATIMATEVPGPYLEVSGAFREGDLSKSGMELVSRKEISVGGLDGILVEADQFGNGIMHTKYLMIFGNENLSILVIAVHPKEQAKNFSKAVREAVLSIVYQPELKVDPFEAVPFAMSGEGTGFDSCRVVMGLLMFTREGGTPPSSRDKASLCAMVVTERAVINDKRATALEGFKHGSGGNHDVKVDSIREVTIDDLLGYEIVGTGVDNKTGERELMYQVILFGYEQITMIIGTAVADYEKNVEAFRRISVTLRHK